MAKTIRKIENPTAILPKKKRVAAYARVSSGKDAMLHSLSAQVSYYSEYIQRNKEWEFIGVYTDEATTGTKDTRPEFQRLLTDCRAGKIDMVVTKSISRFARNVVTLLETTRELKLLGVDVYFEEQNIHTNSGEGEMILTLLASVAQEESRAVSENCKWRIRSQFKNGELANLRFMYGYNITKKGISIDEEQALVVRLIFTYYVNGMGGHAIANLLNEIGITTYSGNLWSEKRVLDIIKNEKYTGNALLQKSFIPDYITKAQKRNNGQLAKYYASGTHSAIITEDVFKKAQHIMAVRRNESEPKLSTTKRYPFSGKLKCALCGQYYRRKTTHGKITWACSTYMKYSKQSCGNKQIPDDILQALTADALGIPAFDENTFINSIKEIIIMPDNKTVFVFLDSHQIELIWQYKSRSESWTDEMRLKAHDIATKGRCG